MSFVTLTFSYVPTLFGSDAKASRNLCGPVCVRVYVCMCVRVWYYDRGLKQEFLVLGRQQNNNNQSSIDIQWESQSYCVGLFSYYKGEDNIVLGRNKKPTCVCVCVLRLACKRNSSETGHGANVIQGYTDSPWAADVHLVFFLLQSLPKVRYGQ